MKKYTIEGGLDFFAELYKSLDVEHDTEDDSNLCLITNEPLTEYFVEMKCGHKFNYIALYKDLVNHRQKYNNMEGSTGQVRLNEIRCPYCRTKQKEILPYYEELGLAKINGVNIIDNTHSYNVVNKYNYPPCEYISENPNFNPTSAESVIEFSSNNCPYQENIHNIKAFKCNGSYAGKFYHYELLKLPGFTDNKCYCYLHKTIVKNKFKQDLKAKIKEANMMAKLKEKEELKKAKEEAKKKAKEEKEEAKKKEKEEKEEAKKKEKEEKQKVKDEMKKTKKISKSKNTIIGPSIVIIDTNDDN